MTIKFGNRENERIETQDGREVWLSRACAVVAQICLYDIPNKTWNVLLGKRGSGTPDFQGHWCFPCGYLDWNETLTQAMIREVYEECGLYLPTLSTQKGFEKSDNPCLFSVQENNETPWHIGDTPGNNKQNISFHYAIFLSWRGDELPALTNKFCEPDEVDDLGWFPIDAVHQMPLAFNHNERLHHLLELKALDFKKVEDNL